MANHPGTKKCHIEPQDGAIDEFISHRDGTNIKPAVPQSHNEMTKMMNEYLMKKPQYDDNSKKKFGVKREI